MISRHLTLVVIFAFASIAPAWAQSSSPPAPSEPKKEVEVATGVVVVKKMENIVATARAAGNLTTFVTALEKAELVKTLEEPGPFTIFAPTDEAFKKLPAGMLDGLLKDKNKLASLLTYHLLAEKVVTAAEIAKLNGQRVATVNGKEIPVSVKDGTTTVGGAGLVATDIKCTNGLIHTIDMVLLPPPSPKSATKKIEKLNEPKKDEPQK